MTANHSRLFLAAIIMTGCAPAQQAPLPEGGEVPIASTDDTPSVALELTDDANTAMLTYTTWIARIDPFVEIDEVGRTSLDLASFIEDVEATDPEVADYLRGTGHPTPEALVVADLVDSADLSNSFPEPPPSVTTTKHWWGYSDVWTDPDSLALIGYVSKGANLARYVPGIVGTVSAVVAKGLLAWMQYYEAKYHGFTVTTTYAGGIWISAP